jgi:hypothetical protein
VIAPAGRLAARRGLLAAAPLSLAAAGVAFEAEGEVGAVHPQPRLGEAAVQLLPVALQQAERFRSLDGDVQRVAVALATQSDLDAAHLGRLERQRESGLPPGREGQRDGDGRDLPCWRHRRRGR